MQVILAGIGGGTAESMTEECRALLRRADCVLGAERLLTCVPPGCRRVAAVRPKELLDALDGDLCVVLYSGDTGFYSGAKLLLPLLKERGIDVKILPGISSVQLLAARLGRPWQDWNLVSAHGVDCDPITAVMQSRPAFFLTGGDVTPATLCRRLTDAGLGDLPVTVGEALTYPEERIRCGSAAEMARETCAPLSVLLAEPARTMERRCSGFPDSAFVRGKVPMTKREVRVNALARLALRPTDVVWDVGAGTGSVSVESAAYARSVYAIECEAPACDLLRRNRETFGAWNLRVVEGRAPDALKELPVPDAVFIGGTKGAMDGIFDAVLEKNPAARICVSAIALETLSAAVEGLTRRGIEARVTQISASHDRGVGGLHMMTAQNPVFLISGNCGSAEEYGGC